MDYSNPSSFSSAVMINPIRKVLELRSGSGGPQQTISILVYLAMFANYVCWTWYGVVYKNPIVFVQNGAGSLLTVFYLYRFGQLSIGAPSRGGGGGGGGSASPSQGNSNAAVVLHPAWLSHPTRINISGFSLFLLFSLLGILTAQHLVTRNLIGAISVVVRLQLKT